MKDSLASRCFGSLVILLCLLGIAGLLIGGRTPFLPSGDVRTIVVHWLPFLMAVGSIVMLFFHRDARDKLQRRKLFEIFSQYGRAKAIALVFGFSLIVYILFLVVGDAGLSKSAVFLSKLLPSNSVVLDVPFLGTHDFSGKTRSLQWVKITIDGHVDQFSFPVSKLTFLPCASQKLRISGNSNWVGLRVNHVECSPTGRTP